MAQYSNTLLAYLLSDAARQEQMAAQAEQMRLQREMQQADLEDRHQQQDFDRMLRTAEMSEKMRQGDFKRRAALAEKMGQTAGFAGKEKPGYEPGTRLEQYARAGYGAGEVARQQSEAERQAQALSDLMKRQTEIEKEQLGIIKKGVSPERYNLQQPGRFGLDIRGPGEIRQFAQAEAVGEAAGRDAPDPLEYAEAVQESFKILMSNLRADPNSSIGRRMMQASNQAILMAAQGLSKQQIASRLFDQYPELMQAVQTLPTGDEEREGGVTADDLTIDD